MHARTSTNTNRSYNLTGRRGTPKQPAVPARPVRHRLKSNRSGISFSANPPQVQTQALYEKSKYNVALVQRAVSTTVAVSQLRLQKQRVPQPAGVLSPSIYKGK